MELKEMILAGLRYYNTHPDKAIQRDPLAGTHLTQYLREKGFFDGDTNRQETLGRVDAALEEMIASGEVLALGSPDRGGRSYRINPNPKS